jgi:hypothetical protein
VSEEPRKVVLSDEQGETLRVVEHDRPLVDSLAYVAMFGRDEHVRLSREEVERIAQLLVDLLRVTVRPARPVSGHDWDQPVWAQEDGSAHVYGVSAICRSCGTMALRQPEESQADFVRRMEEDVGDGTCEEIQVRAVMES